MNAYKTTKELLESLTIEEKIAQLCQMDGRVNTELWVKDRHVGSLLHVTGDLTDQVKDLHQQGGNKIPIIFGIDAIHGHAFHSGATVFPTQLALSSSFDEDLLYKMAVATAKEVGATGMHITFSPVLCVARDMRWGRVDETFGEDPYLIGKLGASLIKGYQDGGIVVCAKHFIAYGESEGGRDSAEAPVSRRKMYTTFLEPFREAVEAGCQMIMAGYNSMDGIPCSANKWLLKDVLRDQLGFDGVVITDWENIRSLHELQKVASSMKEASKIAIEAGNDMIMATEDFYDCALELYREGAITDAQINESCYRILKLKEDLGLLGDEVIENPVKPGIEVHRKLAHECAAKSIILLKNDDDVLPLSKNLKIGLVGPNARNIGAQLGDWSFGPRNPDPNVYTEDCYKDYDLTNHVDIYQGLNRYVGESMVYAKGCSVHISEDDDIYSAVEAVKDCDVIIACMGDDIILNGEMRDRADLKLTGNQIKLLETLKTLEKSVITVLINGKPIADQRLYDLSDAVIEAFNPGMEGGNAVAQILFGDINPSGKLTVSIPRCAAQQPTYYNKLPGWHGDRYVEMDDAPLYPFGYGLSYTEYKYSNLQINHVSRETGISFQVDVTNIGKRTGEEIVQVYVNDIYTKYVTPVKELKGFKKVLLDAGETKTACFTILPEALCEIEADGRKVLVSGEFEVMVGGSSMDTDLLKETFNIK